MKQFTSEERKIHEKIATSQEVSIKDVEEVLDKYWKGVSIKIRMEEPCEIIVPYLGKIIPNPSFERTLKERKKRQLNDEANNA